MGAPAARALKLKPRDRDGVALFVAERCELASPLYPSSRPPGVVTAGVAPPCGESAEAKAADGEPAQRCLCVSRCRAAWVVVIPTEEAATALVTRRYDGARRRREA